MLENGAECLQMVKYESIVMILQFGPPYKYGCDSYIGGGTDFGK